MTMPRALLLCLLACLGCEDKPKSLPPGFVVPEDINRTVEKNDNGFEITYADKSAYELRSKTVEGLRKAGWAVERVESESQSQSQSNAFYVAKGEVEINVFIVKLDAGARLDVAIPASIRPAGRETPVGAGEEPDVKAATPPTSSSDAGAGDAAKDPAKTASIETTNAGARAASPT